jgi:threonine dehydrogenase-like Zn-dependent dehydrogenase
MKHTYEAALRLVLAGRVDLRTIVTHRFPLVETPRAFQLADSYAEDALKVVVGAAPEA